MKRSARDIDDRSVAVIGLACRFPGAKGAAELWQLMRDGVDATGETPRERYDVDALHSSVPGPGTIGSRRAGYVEGVADFDAGFFEMSAAESAELDPQQRLLLMAAWEALEDAGQAPDRLTGSRTGVYVGNARADHLEHRFRQGLKSVTPSLFHSFRALLPARLSYVFDFRGPSVLVDTACSSSLVAVHQAVQSLRVGESPMALAAGVNVALRPDEGVMMTQAGTMARDGRSKFGDASADGFAPSDGVGVVVLKRLADAVADGDRIRAVIQGSAISNDGRTGGALLTPSLTGQAEVLRWALEDAGVAPADVDFVEAHGAGSPTLDPLELSAVGEVLGEGRSPDHPCFIGSVKTNIGHAEAAGGLAGLIKTVLCLEQGEVPPSLHFNSPHPHVAWDDLQLVVPAKPQTLPERGRRPIAGVSAQGASALNAHLVVRQGDVHAASAPARRSQRAGKTYALLLSARTPEALAALAHVYSAYLGPDGPGASFRLRDICYSAATRRQHLPHRLAVTGKSHGEMVEALSGSGGVPAQEWGSGPAAEAAGQFCNGKRVRWDAVFGKGGRYVPLPHYPWQLKRYWLNGQAGEGGQKARSLADGVLDQYARTSSYSNDSLLSDVGVDSLARLEIVVKLAESYGYEGEIEELADLRTVGALREWLDGLEATAA